MMMQDALPGIQRFLSTALLSEHVQGYVVRFLGAFLMHMGRMSAMQAACSVRTEARHRSGVIRFLSTLGWSKDWSVLGQLASVLMECERRRGGTWVFIVDPTYCGQKGKQTENTFSRANYRPRVKMSQRKQKKHVKRSCHSFVMGLLLTPGGLRIPSFRPYYTKNYCEQHRLAYRTQTELGADLIRALVVPERIDMVVLGDSAFDAESIRDACSARGWPWITPVNPERVLAGEKGHRPKVRSLAEGLSTAMFATVRLLPNQGRFVAQRRIASCRLGPKLKARTYYVHRERRAVHSVGEVRIVFSTMQKPQKGKHGVVQKILMSNDLRRSTAEIVELYTLRWQIELFFKELKSTLGLHQYRFREFAKVESWVALALVAFLYLEWHRSQQVHCRDISPQAKKWWRWQKSYGLSQAVRQTVEESELVRLADMTRTPGGLKRLKKQLRAAIPREYRIAA